MKKLFFLFLPLVLIGAGCSNVNTETSPDIFVEEISEGMMIADQEGSDMVVEDEEATESDEEMMKEESMEGENGEETTVGDEEMEAVSFDVDGFMFGYSMEEIRVKKGQKVTINFTSSEGFHDWVVDEFNAATDKINVGGNTSVTFVADKTGEFEYYCSVGQHRANGMVGKLIVE